jgi:hypothetical protein
MTLRIEMQLDKGISEANLIRLVGHRYVYAHLHMEGE